MADEEINRRFDAVHEEMNRRFDAAHEEMNRRFDAVDEEMNRRFDAVDEEMNRRFDAVDEEMNRRFDATANLIQQVATRLDSHIDQSFGDLKARFDRQDARLERHGGLLQGGARATTRLIAWSENADRLWAERDERLRHMEERIRRLEEKS